jgi:hypothetical protein
MKRRIVIALVLLVIATPLILSSGVVAWGEEGHRWINRIAAERLPEDMPAFFRSASARLSYFGPEPDRWRGSRDSNRTLADANDPEHFIDIDKPEDFQNLPTTRFEYAEWLRSVGKDPKVVGLLPYVIMEHYQWLTVLFRMWRDPQNQAEREHIEQSIIHYAGVMGHYVADGSNPHHTTIHYNGWTTSANPENFTREPIHWRFENDFVKGQIKPEDFSGLVKTASKVNDPFADVMTYLFRSNSLVNDLYRMDKTARWEASNRDPKSKQFVAERLAAGSQMLANLWYTAWLNSASGGRPSQ